MRESKYNKGVGAAAPVPGAALRQRLQVLLMAAVCGVGGLLYGLDIGIIDPALPYLHRATRLGEVQRSPVVAAGMGGAILRARLAPGAGPVQLTVRYRHGKRQQVVATFFLPETRGKSLEQIEGLFARRSTRGGQCGAH